MLSQLQCNYPVNSSISTDDECPTAATVSAPESVVKSSVFAKSITIKPKNGETPTIFLVKRIEDDESTELALKIIDVLSAYKAKVFVEEVSVPELNEKKTEGQTYPFHAFEAEEDSNIDLLITIGGDGTILWALQYFNGCEAPPILAYSKGTRNYLCNFSKDGFESSLRKVMEDISDSKAMPVEERSRLKCEIKNTESGKKRTIHALNEITMSRGHNASLAKVDCYVENRYLASFDGDGVMVATPTGSTAYQLSAGGPVVNHLDTSMTITPIAPLNLTTRPLVLPDELTLSFKLNKGSRKDACLNIDGQVVVDFDRQTEITVTGACVPLSFLIPEDNNTLDNWIFRLRNLVGWNRSHF